MRRLTILALALALASCGGQASTSVQPETLAMAEAPRPESEDAPNPPQRDVLILDIGAERFELLAGICNTYDDGTFRFALAEAPLDTNGRSTATIERFDTGAGFKVVVALEGQRDDALDVSWYASGDITAHEMSVSVFGPTITGTARFITSEGDAFSAGAVEGSFSISCSRG